MKKSYIIITLIVLICVVLCLHFGFSNEILNINTNESSNIPSENIKFNDPGIKNNKNNDWYSTMGIIDVSEKGTSLFANNSAYYLANKPNTTSTYLANTYDWKPPFTVEFDIIDIKGDVILNLEDNTNDSGSIHLLSNGAKSGDHVTVNANKNNVRIHIGEKATSRNVTLTNAQVGFKLVPDTSISYKNFVIY